MGLEEDKRLLRQIETGDYDGVDPRKPFIVASVPSILKALNDILVATTQGYSVERVSNRTEDGKVTLTEKDYNTARRAIMDINTVVNELRDRVNSQQPEPEMNLTFIVQPWNGDLNTELPEEPLDV